MARTAMPPRECIRSEKVVSFAAIMLEISYDASNAVPVAPYLTPLFGSALRIVQTVQELKDTRRRSLRLAERVRDLARQVQETVVADLAGNDERLSINIASLQSTLTHIDERIHEWLHKSRWRQFVCRKSIDDALGGCLDDLETAQKLFHVTLLFTHFCSDYRTDVSYSDNQPRCDSIKVRASRKSA
ncbi:hypothetical protein AcV7_002891 [Taiwanofungus camphoratus]|nr:hypothetical protein AcV7_002891 [Antrodia cinnamomea]